MAGDDLNRGSAVAAPKEGTFNVFVTFPHPWPPANDTLASSLQFSNGSLNVFFKASGRLQAELIDDTREINRAVRSCRLTMLEFVKTTISVVWGEVSLDINIDLKRDGVVKVASLLNSSEIPAEINIQEAVSRGYMKDFLPNSID
jgi:hypothetical protein